MKIKTFTVDSFTNKPFKWNPAWVCLLENEIDTEIMQSIATELNLSETAFIKQINDDTFSIRYFTPTIEIDFCWHATLASSKVIFKVFNKKSINLITYKKLELESKSDDEDIIMKFPLYENIEYKASKELYDAFEIDKPISTRFSEDLKIIMIEIKDKETLLKIKPDFLNAVKIVENINAIIVTTKSSDNNYDFYSRCFYPWVWIDEDPVTGSSHCILAKYWSDILWKKELNAYQLSKRWGFMNLKIISNNELEVKSNAKIIFEWYIGI